MEHDEIPSADFDSTWKEALELYFESFMLFFFPHIYAGIDWTLLERNKNPFALVVMAHLKAQAVKAPDERKRWKLHLVRLLYARDYEKRDVLELFRFIDWLIALPKTMEKELREELLAIEEENQMPYVTSIERLGREDGIQEGMQAGAIQEAREMLLEAVDARFETVPDDIASAVEAIETRDMLKLLLRQAITCESLDAFRRILQRSH